MAEFYLVNLASPGLGKLCDGPHSDRAGVEKALYLHRSLGLAKGVQYACAEVTPVEAKSHGANEDAISACNVMLQNLTDSEREDKSTTGGDPPSTVIP